MSQWWSILGSDRVFGMGAGMCACVCVCGSANCMYLRMERLGAKAFGVPPKAPLLLVSAASEPSVWGHECINSWALLSISRGGDYAYCSWQGGTIPINVWLFPGLLPPRLWDYSQRTDLPTATTSTQSSHLPSLESSYEDHCLSKKGPKSQAHP